MQGNKGQVGNNFVDMKVITKRGKKDCVIISIMTDEEYRQSNQDYKRYFTLKDSQGNTFQCGRADFLIQKNK